MDEEKEQQPIIIKKKKGGGHGHHGGAWKVAYADFVTAMMAFFLVMWIVGMSDEIKQNVAAYFSDPVGFNKGKSSGSSGILPGGKGPFEGEGKSITKDIRIKKKEAEVWDQLRDVGKKIAERLEKLSSFSKYKDKIDIELTPEGLRIQLIESDSDSSFFASGSAIMRRDGEEVLREIGKEISKLSYKVVIEGHTDAKKFSDGAKYTNWELSADRANTARRVLISAGMESERIKEIRGFAANQPRIKNDPSNPANRRIAVIVLNQYAAGNFEEIMVTSKDDLWLP